MTRILIAYHSGEGQTAKVAEHMAGVLKDRGAEVDVVVAEKAPSPSGYDGVIAGDSIHAGHHSKELTRWVTQHVDELNELPIALFQVSLTSATDDEEHDIEARRLLSGLVDATGLDPDMVGMFAGALAFTRYGWLKRKLMAHIAAKEREGLDPGRDYEYTDWEAVEHFATDALALMS